PDLSECSGITLLLNDFEDLGMLVHAFHERVVVDFAETLRKGDLLLGREGLVAEKDHKVLEPGGPYLPERFIIQGTQADVGDFSAERSCDRLDFAPPIGCHGLAPFVKDTARGKPTGQRQLGSRPAVRWVATVNSDRSTTALHRIPPGANAAHTPL